MPSLTSVRIVSNHFYTFSAYSVAPKLRVIWSLYSHVGYAIASEWFALILSQHCSYNFLHDCGWWMAATETISFRGAFDGCTGYISTESFTNGSIGLGEMRRGPVSSNPVSSCHLP